MRMIDTYGGLKIQGNSFPNLHTELSSMGLSLLNLARDSGKHVAQ
jgi:hypothetical protein